VTPNLQDNSPEIEFCGYSTMRTSTSSEAEVEPLASDTKGGAAYQRRPAVEAELRAVLLLPQSEWMRQAKTYRPETLMRLIRETVPGDPELSGALVTELINRMRSLMRKGLRGRKPPAAQEIADEVEIRVLRLVLTKSPSRKSDFLEISFGAAIAGYISDACKKYDKTVTGNRGYLYVQAVDDDGDEVERPMELLPSHYPGPEEVVIELREQEHRRALLDQAALAVEDPRHLEAVVLHVVEGMPIVSDDPEEMTLTRYFDVSLYDIQYWLKKGLQRLRQALRESGVTE
jgi:hypothetical protein